MNAWKLLCLLSLLAACDQQPSPQDAVSNAEANISTANTEIVALSDAQQLNEAKKQDYLAQLDRAKTLVNQASETFRCVELNAPSIKCEDDDSARSNLNQANAITVDVRQSASKRN